MRTRSINAKHYKFNKFLSSYARMAQLVERYLGKVKVPSSTLGTGLTPFCPFSRAFQCSQSYPKEQLNKIALDKHEDRPT